MERTEAAAEIARINFATALDLRDDFDTLDAAFAAYGDNAADTADTQGLDGAAAYGLFFDLVAAHKA